MALRDISTEGLRFYVEDISTPDSVLKVLEVKDAFKVSDLAIKSGKTSFVLQFVKEYYTDNSAISALKECSPDAIKFYVEKAANPDAVINQISQEKGLRIANGEVVEVDTSIAVKLAKELSDPASKSPTVFGSEKTGLVYRNVSSGRAIEAALKLEIEGKNSPNAAAYMEIIIEESLRGKGDKGVLGRFAPDGFYIQQALDQDGRFFSAGSEVWKILDRAGIDQWELNKCVIENMLKNKLARIEFVSGNIMDYKIIYPESFGAKEITWLLENAESYGYKLDLENNVWIYIGN